MNINLKVSFIASIALAVSSVIMAAPAQAATFNWNWQESDGLYDANGKQHLWVNDAVGDYDAFSVSYDTDSERLSWSSSFTQVGSNQIDGGWLVISDGPNPKRHDKEFAIFYLDASDINDTRITAYAYNGKNNASSWRTNEFLQSWTNALMVEDNGGERTLSFDLDVSGINSANVGSAWKGSQFGDHLGVWFHAGRNTRAAYDNEDGSLTHFQTQAKWFDSAQLHTTKDVPEPLAVSSLGLVAGAIVTRHRKNLSDD